MLPSFHIRTLRRLALLACALGIMLAFAAPASGQPPHRGVQLHSLWWDSSNQDMDRELDLARDAGSTTVRVDVGWSSLETGGKGQFSSWYVEKLDRFVAGARARNMKVIATLLSTPCWASSAPASLKQDCAGSWWDRGVDLYPPTSNTDYADIARWLTNRHGADLAALEIWNEPNLDDQRFWKTSDPAGDYARLLKAAYPAAKAGNSDVPVLAGALGAADLPFLQALYSHGIQGHYDGLAIHPYNEGRAPGDMWQEQWKQYTFLPGLQWVRAGQLAAGDTKPIWITEMGWTTGNGTAWEVSEAQQATYVKDGLLLLNGMPYVEAAMVYNLRSKGTDPNSFEDNFGLVRRDFTPKPAYAALREGLNDGSAPPPPETPPPGGGSPPSGGSPPGGESTPGAVTPAGPHPSQSGSRAPADAPASGSSSPGGPTPAATPSTRVKRKVAVRRAKCAKAARTKPAKKRCARRSGRSAR